MLVEGLEVDDLREVVELVEVVRSLERRLPAVSCCGGMVWCGGGVVGWCGVVEVVVVLWWDGVVLWRCWWCCGGMVCCGEIVWCCGRDGGVK